MYLCTYVSTSVCTEVHHITSHHTFSCPRPLHARAGLAQPKKKTKKKKTLRKRFHGGSVCVSLFLSVVRVIGNKINLQYSIFKFHNLFYMTFTPHSHSHSYVRTEKRKKVLSSLPLTDDIKLRKYLYGVRPFLLLQACNACMQCKAFGTNPHQITNQEKEKSRITSHVCAKSF